MKKRFVNCLLIVVSALLFYSCGSTTYYYSTLTPLDEEALQDENGDFIYENDTLSVAYHFNGKDFPINISIYNKLGEPFYLDWSKSTLIVEDEPVCLADNALNMGGYDPAHSNPYSILIPPLSQVDATLAKLENLRFDRVKDSEFEPMEIVNNKLEMNPVKIRYYSFQDSPLYFKTCLTFYMDSTQEAVEPFVVQQEFYISELLKTSKIEPYQMNSNYRNRGNVSYALIEKKSPVLKVAGITATSVLLLMYVVVSSLTEDLDY